MLSSVIGTSISLASFLICILSAIVLGILSAIVFSINSKYTSSWKISIALLPAVVAIVIMMVNGNIGAGLAVAGTFALVRFRSMPGSAKEVTGLFFAVSLGLICGMGYIGIAVIFFVIMAVAVLVLSRLHFGEKDSAIRTLKVVIPETLDYDTIFDDVFEKYLKHCETIKIRTTNMGTLYELTYEVILKDNEKSREFIDELRTRNGNLNIILARDSENNLM